MGSLFTPSRLLKLGLKTAAALACAVFLFWFTADLWARCKLPFIETTLSAVVHHPVTVQSARYDLFKGFLLNDVTIHRRAPVLLPVHIARVRILPAFEWKLPGIRIRKVVFEKPEVSLSLRAEDLSETRTFLQGLPTEFRPIGALRVRMESYSFRIVKGSFSFLSPDGASWRREFKDVDFSLDWKKKGREIRDISLKAGPIELKGQGEMGSGFALSSKPLKLEKFSGLFSGMEADSGNVQVNVTLKGGAKNFEPAMVVIFSGCALHDAERGIWLSEASGLARISKDGAELRDVWASLNNRPFRLNAKAGWRSKVFFSSGLSLDGKFLKVRAVSGPSGWDGYARLRTAGKEWTASWCGLKSRLERLSCRSFQLRLRDRRDSEAYSAFSLHRLFFRLSSDGRSVRGDVSETLFRGAPMTAGFWLRLKDFAWGLSASVKELEVSRLLFYVSKTYPVTGRMSAKLACTGTPETLECEMPLKVVQGRIGPSESSSSWARQTGIDGLSAIRFDSFSGTIRYARGAWILRGIRLDGDSLRVASNLKVDHNRVAGSLSISFPTASVEASSDLQGLLRFVRAGEWVDFDFKVAGHLHSPRVQWLGGEFKKKIESRLAPWMKRELARQIEKRMSGSAPLPAQ